MTSILGVIEFSSGNTPSLGRCDKVNLFEGDWGLTDGSPSETAISCLQQGVRGKCSTYGVCHEGELLNIFCS